LNLQKTVKFAWQQSLPQVVLFSLHFVGAIPQGTATRLTTAAVSFKFLRSLIKFIQLI